MLFKNLIAIGCRDLTRIKVKQLWSEKNKIHIEVCAPKRYDVLKQTYDALINVYTLNENILKDSSNYVLEQEISASIYDNDNVAHGTH